MLNEMIENQQSGTIDEIGEKLGIKRRQVFAYLNALSALGREPVFDTKKRSFVYSNGCEWNIKWPGN